MSPSITLRKAEPGDMAQVSGIIADVVADGDTYTFAPETPIEELTGWWFSPEKHVYVAADGAEILGSFWLKPNQPGLGDHVCNAAYMVAKAARRKGVGRAMAIFSLDEARKLDFSAMQFNFVVASNSSAVNLWKSIGMKIIGEIPDAFRSSNNGLTNAYIMYRKL